MFPILSTVVHCREFHRSATAYIRIHRCHLLDNAILAPLDRARKPVAVLAPNPLEQRRAFCHAAILGSIEAFARAKVVEGDRQR